MRAKETRWGPGFVPFEMAFVVAEALRDAANRGPSELVADAILARTSDAPGNNLKCPLRGRERYRRR
jgi:hypothetical protein